ncbi:monooxygenase [Streptomyces sp. SUK 48]|uniref:monooxygenase n=1 Tax=Streptomyces sp. SUK 48 TaxID=2582831 RepID=UPI00129A2431|nr:monooxygenase [Streptomyces sp. SUK 48]
MATTYLLQVDFPHNGPFGEQMATEYRQLAESINDEPGLIWKIWTENSEAGEAGGIYLFGSEADAQRYLAKHTERLRSWGITDVRGRIFAVNGPLSAVNRGPLTVPTPLDS